MDKTFEYRIYPSAGQEDLLQKTFGCCRWAYNKVLAARRDEYARTGRLRHINSYITQIPAWKKTDAPWLSEVDSMALRQSLRDLERACRNFFRAPGRTGFPKFRSKHAGRKSYRTNRAETIDARHVKLPKLGTVRARVSRPIEGRVLSATVKQVPSGKYYVTICCTDIPAVDAPTPAVEFLGIDAGIRDIATCSTGERLSNPRNLQRSERKLAREQRRLSRKQKGSANRARQCVKVARAYEKVANRRKDALHKFTTHAVGESQAIAVENLDVRGMEKNRHLAKAVGDTAMSELARQLEYKYAWSGRGFVRVDRFYPSSKTCSACGYVHRGLTLAERAWDCPACGARHDRDLNAAVNIAREGARLLNKADGTAGLAGTAA